ncbi:glucosaminidase domain-containing protein [Nocardia xishanensis]|uniref:Glucosaminidase domain-containing protein n=1 Tax=Nocardia xishanensis TaxID=238964 RepID=A0ABW7X9X3_9NOCA
MSIYAESPIFASPESTPDPGMWPTREDVFAEDAEYIDETTWHGEDSDTEWAAPDSVGGELDADGGEIDSDAGEYGQEYADLEGVDVEAADYQARDYQAVDYEAADYQATDYQAVDFEAADYEDTDYEAPDYEDAVEAVDGEDIDYGEMDYEDVDAEDFEPEDAPPTDRAKGIVRRGTFTGCAGRAQPGARAMAAQWRRLTGRKAGTYNCRGTSLHGEGRSIDLYALVSDPVERAQAESYIKWMQDNAVELQVAYIIWNRQQWNWQLRHKGWRPYGGSSPHTNHIHVDLSVEGARTPSSLFDGPVPGLRSGVGPVPSRPPAPTPARSGAPATSPALSSPPRSAPAQAPARNLPAHVVEFVRRYRPHAIASQTRTNIPWLVTLGQAAVASGWGRSSCGNNVFGITAPTSIPASQRKLCTTRKTHRTPTVRYPEVISVTKRPDGRYDYVVREWLRTFDSPDSAFEAHARVLMAGSRYSKAFARFGGNPYVFAQEVAAAGYATAPGYGRLLDAVMRMIERVPSTSPRRGGRQPSRSTASDPCKWGPA